VPAFFSQIGEGRKACSAGKKALRSEWGKRERIALGDFCFWEK